MYNHGKMNGADHVEASTDLRCNVPPYAQFKYVDNSAGVGLSAPRGFVAIPTSLGPEYFLQAKRSPFGPNDD